MIAVATDTTIPQETVAGEPGAGTTLFSLGYDNEDACARITNGSCVTASVREY